MMKLIVTGPNKYKNWKFLSWYEEMNHLIGTVHEYKTREKNHQYYAQIKVGAHLWGLAPDWYQEL